jgi:hypothetical protein
MDDLYGPQSRVYRVAQGITEKIEAHHRYEDGESWKGSHMRCGVEISSPITQHIAPGWHGRLYT